MQPRVLHLLRRAGLAPGEVPASNVVFMRSPREDSIKSQFKELADMCWKLHQAAIEQFKPRVILCFGSTTSLYVRQKLEANILVSEFVETNKRNWRSCSFRNRAGIMVVAATHPSIADWTAVETDPSDLVIEGLAT